MYVKYLSPGKCARWLLGYKKVRGVPDPPAVKTLTRELQRACKKAEITCRPKTTQTGATRYRIATKLAESWFEFHYPERRAKQCLSGF